MHTLKDKARLLARVRRMRGQLDAVERALEAEADCESLMHQLAGIRGALAGLTAVVVEDHVKTHLVDPQTHPGALDPKAADALMTVIRTYLR